MKPTLNTGILRSKAFEANFKAGSADGQFSGYGSVFGVKDSYGEVVVKGAFVDSLAKLERNSRTLPVLWQHKTDTPIGNWATLAEDDVGLAGDGQLWLAEAPQAPLAYKGMQTKSITGLSIGYYVKEYTISEVDDDDWLITLTALDLVEISVVTSPANDEARVEVVKSKLARGEMPALAEVEKYLREAGFSRSQATQIVSRGMKDVRSESEGTTAVLTALRGFNL